MFSQLLKVCKFTFDTPWKTNNDYGWQIDNLFCGWYDVRASVNKAKSYGGDDFGTIGLSVAAVFVNEKFTISRQKTAGRGL